MPILGGEASVHAGALRLLFQIEDSAQQISDLWSPQSYLQPVPRAHELWKMTCFEAFWSLPNMDKYWELNLSPWGQWNLYAFDRYREPQPPRECFEAQLLSLNVAQATIEATLQIPTNWVTLEMSLCAVVRTHDLGVQYYSSCHAGNKPDFHLRQSFNIERSLS